MPRVSIVVPNYNHARFLRQRIESVLGQTFTDWELILLDDASTDGSAAILAEYARRPGVRLEVRATNSGSPFVQWNRGVQLAQGEYVWIAESDDYADARLLERLVPLLRDDPQVVLAHALSLRVDEDSRVVGSLLDLVDTGFDRTYWDHDFVADGVAETARHMVWCNMVPNASAVLFRRERYLEAGGAPEGMRLCGDWMMWLKMIRAGKMAYVSAPLNCFRFHASSVRSGTKWLQNNQERWQVQNYVASTFPLPASVRRKLAAQVLNEILDHVRPAPRGKRWPLFRECARHADAILRGSVTGVAAGAGRRGVRMLCRRMKGSA